MAPLRSIAPTDPRLSWEGAISLETTAERHVVPWRLPHTRLSLFPSYEPWGDLSYVAALVSGIRISFLSDTVTLAVRQRVTDTPRPLDICCEGRLVASLNPDTGGWYRHAGLPPGNKQIELWLPHGARFELCELHLSAGASLERTPDVPHLKWITYGSSITQAGGASSPAQTWAAIVARHHNVDLTNLGFTGHCQLEPMVARLVRDRPVDALSICAGANSYDGALTRRTFRAALIGFVQIVREQHPRIPIALISPIISPPRETVPNAAGWTLPLMREEVAAATAALKEHGDAHVFHVNGLDLFGAGDLALLPDDVHPSAGGYRLIAERFNSLVAPLLFNPASPRD
ncbi:MAG: lipolytic protein family [Rariglobus sp.]|jgi:lysophospholipase L1-like esterase|nr:lipolytic protein family [Rariglobus sp.]